MTLEEIKREQERLCSPEAVSFREQWLATRPEVIQKLARRWPPEKVYRLAEGSPIGLVLPGDLLGIASYLEDGTVTVRVLKDGPRSYTDPTLRIGINPAHLEEHEL